MSAGGIRAGRAFVEFGANSAPLEAAIARLRGRLQAFGSGLAAVGGGLMAASGGVLGALAWPLQLAANLETTQAAFETMLKDGNAAKALLEDIQQFAASTPFEFPELATAAKSLLAFGVSASDVQGTLRTLGDIASGIGIPIGELSELYGKAKVQGRLFAEDVNQLTGRGIPVIQEFAKQFGVSDSKVKELVESGKIGFPQLQKALADLTTGSGTFAGGMERQSRTLLGVFSTLKDSIGQAVRPLGQALLPAVAKIAGHISTAVAVMGRFLEQNSQLAVYVAGGAVAIGAMGAALVGIGGTIAVTTFAVGGLVSAFGMVWGVGGAAIAALGALLGVLASPLGIVAVAVAGVSQAFGGWAELLRMIQTVSGTLWASMRDGVNGVSNAFGTLYQAWQAVVAAVAAGNMEAAMDVVGAGMQLSWLQTTGALSESWTAFRLGVLNGWTDTITTLAQHFEAFLVPFEQAWAAVVGAMKLNWAAFAGAIADTVDFALTRFAQLGALMKTVFTLTPEQVRAGQTKAENDVFNLEQGLQERQRQRDAWRANRGVSIAAETLRNMGAVTERAADYYNALNALADQEKAVRGNANNAAAQAAEARLNDAKRRFGEVQAEMQRQLQESQNRKAAALGQAAEEAKKVSESRVGGAFNVSLASQQIGLNSIQQSIANNTKQTAKGVQQLVDAGGGGILRAG